MRNKELQSFGSKFWAWVLGISLLVTATFVGILLSWSFASEKVLEIKNEPFPIRTIRKNASVNGVVILSIDYCKNRDIEGEVRVSFVSDEREIFLPIAREQIPKGCKVQEVPIVIPKDLQPDTYRLKFRTHYDINPLKSVDNIFESRMFEVVQENVN